MEKILSQEEYKTKEPKKKKYDRIWIEKLVKYVFMLAAITSVISMVLIAGFTLAKG
jgi:hypothetical protein